MRLALTAGGTGGHIFPALSVLQALRRRPGAVSEVCFFGPEDRGERTMVESHGLRFVSVPSGQVRGRGPLALGRSIVRLAWGTLVALRRLRAFRPDAVFSTGGYASFPASVAARLLRKPLIVYLPDVRPGWAVQAEMRLATRVATTAEAALSFLPREKTTVTGYPVREEFFTLDRAAARNVLGIAPEARVLLIAGASQGASAINGAIFEGLRRLAPFLHIIHVTGKADIALAESHRLGLSGEAAERYEPAAFRADLPAAMLAADLAVMRAGASTLGELTAAGLAAILVPGTFAGGHQRDNANWLAHRGAATVLEESLIDQLPDLILSLMNDEPRLSAMGEAARSLARPGAAEAIADLIMEAGR